MHDLYRQPIVKVHLLHFGLSEDVVNSWIQQWSNPLLPHLAQLSQQFLDVLRVMVVSVPLAASFTIWAVLARNHVFLKSTNEKKMIKKK